MVTDDPEDIARNAAEGARETARDEAATAAPPAAADLVPEAGSGDDAQPAAVASEPDGTGAAAHGADAGEPPAPAPDAEPDLTVDALMAGPPVLEASDQLVAIVEALVFASPEPITQKAMFKLLDTEPREDVQAAIAALKRRYEERAGGLQLVEVAGGYQIVTRSELHEWVRRMFHERTTQKLSVQALETLAVIAYKQPVTAAEITDIRGVNTSGVIGTLLERGLVKISGRKQVVGRPFLYSTTREFLDRFGLRDLTDLPKVEDMADALGFEVPAGIAIDAAPVAPAADEPATEEDAAVLAGTVGFAEPGAEIDSVLDVPKGDETP